MELHALAQAGCSCALLVHVCMYVCSLIFLSIMLIDSLYSFAFLGIQGG